MPKTPRELTDLLGELPEYDARLDAIEAAMGSGGSVGDMRKADNLSGLANNDTALANLGAGTGTGGGRDVFKAANAAAVRSALLLGTTALTTIGTASGNVFVLDSGGKVPLAVLPEAILGAMKYQSAWDASTNTPTLSSPPAASTKGYFYIVSVAGSTDLAGGVGTNEWKVGDWAVSNGTRWDKIDSSDQVNSVAGLMGTITAANLKTALALTKADVGLGNVDNTADVNKNVLSATKWTTGRTLSISGDLSYTSPTIDGTGNVTAAGTLATVNGNVGTFTNATVTVDAKGRVTAASNGAGGALREQTNTATDANGANVRGWFFARTAMTIEIAANRVGTGGSVNWQRFVSNGSASAVATGSVNVGSVSPSISLNAGDLVLTLGDGTNPNISANIRQLT